MLKTKSILDSSTWNENPGFLRLNLETAQQEAWKPSELEAAVLKIHFKRNQFPTREEREEIIRAFYVQFNSQVTQVQLANWFQNERDKIFKNVSKESVKNIYKKFEKKELDFLVECFSENNYPPAKKMSELAELMNCNISKIENWYKHYRRTQARQGNMKLKTKKYFKKEELSFLSDLFDQNTHPTALQLQELAERFNCNLLQMKSWFSNRRKKVKQIQSRNKLEQIPITDGVSTCDSQSLSSSYSNNQQYYSSFSPNQNMTLKTANFDANLPTSGTSKGFPVNLNQYMTINSSEKALMSYENTQSVQQISQSSFLMRSTSEPISYPSPGYKINSYGGFQNNTIVNFPMANNPTINSLLPTTPSLICLNQPNARPNEPTQPRMIVQNIPVAYVAFVPVSNVPFLNFPLHNNGLSSLK